MLYYIFGILVGIYLIVNGLILLKRKFEIVVDLIYIFGGFILIGTSIVGFFIEKDFEFIVMLILLTITIVIFILNMILKKKIQ